MVLRLKLLGEFALRDASGAELSLPTRKTRALLGYLAVNADRPQPRERLMALLWSDRSERQARHSLNQALLLIRKLADGEGAALLDSDGERVTLRSDAVDCDVARLRALIEDNPAEAAALYDGPLLDGLSVPDPAFEEWLLVTRSELHALACDALAAAMNGDDTAVALDCARRLIALDPLREDAHRRLMKLLHQSGDRAGALRQYEACAEILQRELQVEPDVATRALFSDITENRQPDTRVRLPLGTLDALLAPERPSIAVLPFANMSGDPEQEYFADGIAEDIIYALSRFSWFFVIARNSSFSFKGQTKDVKHLARELGVQYVLEGSVRKSGNRVRITAQLIDARMDRHVWAERYDRDLEDIFSVQDEITEQVIASVAPGIVSAEMQRAYHKDVASLDAWDRVMRAHWHLARFTMDDYDQARRLLYEAVQIEPNSALALGDLAMIEVRDAHWRMGISREQSLISAAETAQRAVAIDEQNSWGHIALAFVDLYARRHDESVRRLKRAIEICPNDPHAHGHLGSTFAYAGERDAAFTQTEKALRLSPKDPFRVFWFTARGIATFSAGQYESAVEWANKIIEERPHHPGAYRIKAASCGQLGEFNEAKTALKELLRQMPGLTITKTREQVPWKNIDAVERYADGLRRAGLPE